MDSHSMRWLYLEWFTLNIFRVKKKQEQKIKGTDNYMAVNQNDARC